MVDAAADGFWMTDLDGKIPDVNDAYQGVPVTPGRNSLDRYAWDVDAEKDRDQVIAEVLQGFRPRTRNLRQPSQGQGRQNLAGFHQPLVLAGRRRPDFRLLQQCREGGESSASGDQTP